jgi:hypothetical protein
MVISTMYQMKCTKAYRCREEWSGCKSIFYESTLDDILLSIHCGEKAASEAGTGIGLLLQKNSRKGLRNRTMDSAHNLISSHH